MHGGSDGAQVLLQSLSMRTGMGGTSSAVYWSMSFPILYFYSCMQYGSIHIRNLFDLLAQSITQLRIISLTLSRATEQYCAAGTILKPRHLPQQHIDQRKRCFLVILA